MPRLVVRRTSRGRCSGTTRDAAAVLADQHARISRNDQETERRLHHIKALVPPALDALKNNDATALGRILGRHWELKRRLGEGVSLPLVDRAYAEALTAGATGGKVLGAGGGGYLLLHAPDQAQADVRAVLSAHGGTEQPFRFADRGAEILHVPRPEGRPGGRRPRPESAS